jgi:hypothetical protein
MSYFSNAYRKSFVGTKATQVTSPTTTGVDDGFITDTGIPTSALSNLAAPNTLGPGCYGFFDPTSYLSVNSASASVTSGLPLIFAGASLYANDKIGPFHGGYKESNKSKMINPKYINKWARMQAATPEQAVYHVGNTNLNSQTTATLTLTAGGALYTNGVYTNILLTTVTGTGAGLFATVTVAGGIVTVVTIVGGGQGFAIGDTLTVPAIVGPGTGAVFTVATIKYSVAGLNQICDFEFLCGETYNLQFNLWGAQVLRYLNHDLYKTLAAYTGCCPTGALAPTPVDSTLVMIDWADQVINDVWLKDFIRPIVYTQSGVPLFATAAEAVAAGFPGTQVWTTYVSPGYVAGTVAGLRFVGAYVETGFGNCSFQKTDYFDQEIVQMSLQMMDLDGNPCNANLCSQSEYSGFAGQGSGEVVFRDVILDESYLQNHFASDSRIREITQGDQLFTVVPRTQRYTRYILNHSVPRYNNPTGIYDNDQYSLNIYVPATAGTAAAFETFVSTWLTSASSSVALETFDHTPVVTAAL